MNGSLLYRNKCTKLQTVWNLKIAETRERWMAAQHLQETNNQACKKGEAVFLLAPRRVLRGWTTLCRISPPFYFFAKLTLDAYVSNLIYTFLYPNLIPTGRMEIEVRALKFCVVTMVPILKH
jgi:hypothetical protein